jgi:hypothetical protein
VALEEAGAMTSDGQSVERLREYLRNLKPEARALLIAELERAQLRGDDMTGSELVLEELRRTIRIEAQRVPRIGDAARLFFMPFEPFLIDAPADHKRVGRIARLSLEPIWGWIGRDLMPAEAKALTEDINRALLADDKTKADQLVRALHERAILRMRETLATVGTDEKAQRRLAIQVGTPRATDDVATLLHVLEVRDLLADLAKRLPNYVRVFEREVVEQAKVHIDAACAAKSLGGDPSRKADIVRYGVVLLMSRLAAPWQLIRLATRVAESDVAARVAETPYAAAVAIVLSEMEATVSELRAAFRAGKPVTSMLKELHGAARGLRTEMDLSVESAWSRQLAAIRSDVSNLLKSEIDAAPGRVRRLLRPPPAKEIRPGSTVDSIEVDDVQARVEFVNACRNYAGELALSEVTLRAYSELTQYLETGTRVLLDALRHAEAPERPFRQSQVEAAIRLCRTLFGADYAELLGKAADVAVQAATTERKSIRA